MLIAISKCLLITITQQDVWDQYIKNLDDNYTPHHEGTCWSRGTTQILNLNRSLLHFDYNVLISRIMQSNKYALHIRVCRYSLFYVSLCIHCLITRKHKWLICITYSEDCKAVNIAQKQTHIAYCAAVLNDYVFNSYNSDKDSKIRM